MKTQVVNLKTDSYDVYIGRGSKWGNPFKIGEHGTREEVIEKYEDWLKGEITSPDPRRQFPPTLESAIEELLGKRLGCFCKPKACHGDVLVRYLKEYETE